MTGQTAGTSFNITLSAVDAANNLVTTYAGSKTVSYSGPANAPGGTSPTYTTTVTFANGQATGVATTLVNAAATTITPTISGLTGVASSSVTVAAGPANKLAFTTQPGGGQSRIAWTTQPVVTLQDANGNTKPGIVQNVTLAIQNNAGPGGVLGGTKTVAVNTATGMATFNGLSIDKPGAGYTLTAKGDTMTTTPGLVVSNAFSVAGLEGGIVWGPATTIAGDSDVTTDGVLMYAVHWGGTDDTVNGVAFTAPSGTTVALAGGTTLGGAPTVLSPAYRNILKGENYQAQNRTATLYNLTVGKQYKVQIWCQDTRYETWKTTTITGGPTLTPNTGGTDKFGQYASGTFTANDTTLQIAFTAGNDGIVNAIQVRDVTGGTTSDYTTWANGTFVPPLTAKLPGDDQDGDLHTNAEEYAFGTEPTVSSNGPITYVSGGAVTAHGQPVIVPQGNDYYMVFGRRVDYETSGLTYKVQFSIGLDEWVDNDDVANAPVQVATDGTINAMRVPYPDFINTPSGTQKPTFSRVKVSMP